MTGNEWPPFAGQEEGEMPNIAMSLPSSDLRNAKKEEEIKYHASSLNSAYHQLRKHGLVVVTNEFNKLCKGPKMEVFQGENRLGTWGLVKAAVKKPAKGVIRDGENWPAKSLSGTISSSSMIPLDTLSRPKVVNSCKKRRRQKLTRAKVVQLSNHSLFKGVCKKKRKRRGKRTKKNKGAKCDSDAKKQVNGQKMVGSGNQKDHQKKDFPDLKWVANKDFDQDAKVCQHYHISLVCLSRR